MTCSRERELVPPLITKAADSYLGSSPVCETVKTNAMGSFDIVTDADETAQRIIVDGLRELFPDDDIIAEEGMEHELGQGRTWVVDPIDGTLNYDRCNPLFGTQLALLIEGRPVFSAVCLPAMGEMYVADASGATLNGRPLGPLRSRPLKECIVSTGDFSRKKVYWRDKHQELIGAMRDEVARIRMMGAACSDFTYLASGRTDIHVRFVNKLWDFVPGMFLAEKAGAYYDAELLERTRLLVICASKEISDEFASKVLSKVEISGRFPA